MLLSDVGSLQDETSSQADQDQHDPGGLHQETSDPEIKRLQDELQSALNEVKSVEREAEVAKEAAGTELVLMRRQLTSCQAALVEAEQVFSPPMYLASQPHAHPRVLWDSYALFATCTCSCRPNAAFCQPLSPG